MKRATQVKLDASAAKAIRRFQKLMKDAFGAELSQSQAAGMLIHIGAEAEFRLVRPPVARVTFPEVVELASSAEPEHAPEETSVQAPTRQPRPKRELRTGTCACGCGGTFETRNPDRKWLPGHNPKRGASVRGGKASTRRPPFRTEDEEPKGRVVWDGTSPLMPPWERSNEEIL